jgi:hypothetical protein
MQIIKQGFTMIINNSKEELEESVKNIKNFKIFYYSVNRLNKCKSVKWQDPAAKEWFENIDIKKVN